MVKKFVENQKKSNCSIGPDFNLENQSHVLAIYVYQAKMEENVSGRQPQ